jgi:signal transduction histidine kinase
MWLSYYVPSGDAELNGRFSAWIGYRPAVASPVAELRAARAANAALAAENARLRAALDDTSRRLADRDHYRLEQVDKIAHQVRTPLGLIKGYIGTLLNNELRLDPASRQECLQIIDEEVDAVSRVINHLVDLARMDAGALQLDTGPVDLGRLVRDRALRKQGGPTTHPLRVELAAGLPAVWGDRARLEQVLDELVDNATHFSPPGSPIAIQGRLTADEQAVQITVRDSGPGIPAEALPYLFAPFYRAAQGDSRQGGGVGLGLALAYGWIEAHQGRLWGENRADGGAAFHFTVPTVAAARTATKKEPSAPASRRPGYGAPVPTLLDIRYLGWREWIPRV